MAVAGIYCRISSDPTGQALGVGRQEADCRALAADLGWKDVRVYIDNDVSAYSSRPRPEFEAMLEDAREGVIRAIFAWHPDRLARRIADTERLVDLAEAHDLDVVTVQAGRIDYSSPTGRLQARMGVTIARYESEHRSDRVRRKLQENAHQGRPHGRRAYGWERLAAPDENGMLERVVEAEAAVLRDAAAAVLEGQSLRAIVANLNERGVPAPASDRWERNKLRELLKRPRNAGRAMHQGVDVGPGLWPPILEADQHLQLIAVLTDPRRRTSTGTSAAHLLSGIGLCGVCGATLRVGKNRGVASYRCSAKSCVSRRKVDVDGAIERVVVARLSRPDVAELFPAAGEEDRAARDELDRLLLLRDQLDDDRLDGSVTHDQFKRSSASLNQRIEAVDATLRRTADRNQLSNLLVVQDASTEWASWPLTRRRAVIDLLMEVRLLPAGPGARVFDPGCLDIVFN